MSTAIPLEQEARDPVRLPMLTNSEMKSFRACARRHHYAYDLLYRPAETASALRFGALVHLALEAWWLNSGDERLEAAIAAIARATTPQSDPVDAVKAEELLRGYHYRWIDDADRYEVIAVEAPFVAPLRNPETGAESRTFQLAGKIDLIVRERATGRVLLVEHKTSAENIGAGSEYWRCLTLDGQVSTYFVGARALGHDPQGCLYDVLARPKLARFAATPPEARKYTKGGLLYANQRAEDESLDDFRARLRAHIAENPDRYFQRDEIVRLEDEEREAAYDTWQIGRLIREAQLAERWPRNPDACAHWGRTCEFFDVCTGVASLTDTTRFRRATAAHEELA